MKPFRDEASKFGALWGYKGKFKSGHENKQTNKQNKTKQTKKNKENTCKNTHSSLGLTGPNFAFGRSF